MCIAKEIRNCSLGKESSLPHPKEIMATRTVGVVPAVSGCLAASL